MESKLDISREELCDLYTKKKLSSIEIGKIFNCSFITVLNKLRKFGIPIRSPNEVRKLDIKKEQLQILYGNKKMSSVEIGKIFNCGFVVILKRLREFGIPIRDRGVVRKFDISREGLRNLYTKKKLSSIKIGEIFNCGNVTVIKRIKKFGIPVRNHSEANKNPSPETLKRILRRRIPSSLEEKFRDIVNKYDLPYKYVGNGAFILGSYNPDFINTNSEKIAIEVYARYYKRRNKVSIEEWKKKREQVFKSYGWKLLFFNEIEVNEKNVLKVLSPEALG